MAKKSSRLYRTLGELRRRHVIRVVGAYAVCAWLTLQVAAIIFPALMVPDWVLTVLVVLGLAGLPVVAILTWVYDITPAGVVRTIPADAPSDERFPIPAHWNWRWLDYLVIVALLAILAFVLIDREADEIDPGQSIAVLPFSDLSDDGDHSYFSDGLAEALIDSLASVPGLRVISRTSSFSFRDGLTDVRKVASELGVDSVLEGSVRKSAQRVRISARLVDGRRGHSLWSQSYEGDLEDIFEVQDTIARSIAEVMQLEIHGDQRLIDRSTDDSHAYEQYLRGRAKLRSLGTLENIELAIVHFEQALELDPHFALAHAGLCTAMWQRYDITQDSDIVEPSLEVCRQAELFGDRRTETHVAMGNLHRRLGALEQARAAFMRALLIDPDNGEAYAGMAPVHFAAGDLDAAEDAVRRAMGLDPAYWRNYSILGAIQASGGDLSEAIVSIEKAIALEPGSPRAYWNLGAFLFLKGNYQEAAEAFRSSIERGPSASAYANAGTNYFYIAEYDRAVEMFREAAALSPSDFRMHGYLADALRMANGSDEEIESRLYKAIDLARSRLEVNPGAYEDRATLALYLARTDQIEQAQAELERMSSAAHLSENAHWALGETYLALGDKDQAIEHVMVASEKGLPLFLLTRNPAFEPLHDHPRFRQLKDSDSHSPSTQ